jgi:hypothetical protein
MAETETVEWEWPRLLDAARRPFVTDIWFVDQPGWYEWFIAQFPQTEAMESQESLIGRGALRPLSGIDLHDWRRAAFDPATEVIASPEDTDVAAILRRGNMEKIVWPWVCAVPGVWLRWSDGRYQMVAVVASHQEEAV